MVEPSFGEQMASLNSTLRSIEVRLALGRAPVEGLEDFKSSLDDMRLRLWGLLSAAGGKEEHAFQELFRIRRATEMSRALGSELKAGNISGRHKELVGLRDAASDLIESIDVARQHAF